jgi:hypothetical protein
MPVSPSREVTAVFEITDRFIEAGDASALLYAPLARPLTFRSTRRYEFDFEGDAAAVDAFVRHTLLDSISQELHIGDDPALTGFLFVLDYGMRPDALDLEKETVVNFFKGIENPGFALNNLTIRQRIYVFGEGEANADRFIRDICNGAVHNWRVIKAA